MNDNQSAYPDDNPKTIHGVKKVPLHLVPPSASHALALGFADGAVKYGPYNWRDKTVSMSIYIAAAKRHIDAFWDGEEVASDSQVPHLAHAMACLAIIYDGLTIGKINDDRPTKGASPALQKEYAENKNKEENAKERITDAGDVGLARRWRDRVEQPRVYSELPRWGDPESPSGNPVDGSSNAVEHGRVSDLQADIQSGYVRSHDLIYGDAESEFYYTTDGGVERYDHSGNRILSHAVEGRVLDG